MGLDTYSKETTDTKNTQIRQSWVVNSELARLLEVGHRELSIKGVVAK